MLSAEEKLSSPLVSGEFSKLQIMRLFAGDDASRLQSLSLA